MNSDLLNQIMNLKQAPLEAIKSKYTEVFDGENPCSRNRTTLLRKIIYRLQEIEHGGLSEKTQGHISELIEKYDPVNNNALRPDGTPEEKRTRKITARDRRLPIPG
ncbi:MAG: DUF2924 domain-containing protein, partial [Candidatus Omnitrophica bacterium]|nr:DUF2924 domain-containing protein [Candidatus Omnitrophota bacterium]